MKSKEGIHDGRFIVTYQNVTTGREHSVLVDACDLEDVIEWHKARRNLVSIVPYVVFREPVHV